MVKIGQKVVNVVIECPLIQELKPNNFLTTLGASNELKEIVIESGHQAETLFERVNDGYQELTVSKLKIDLLTLSLFSCSM